MRNDRKFSKCSVTMDMHVQVCVCVLVLFQITLIISENVDLKKSSTENAEKFRKMALSNTDGGRGHLVTLTLLPAALL